ncbi:MAG: fused response regulator/phosphatase [Gammaproteobacteria bacterium]|nr:fused response regulator/phosphatase [Gammaproteobacteria bacterium]
MRGTLLVVDDDESNRLAAQALLSRHYDVLTAESGEQALSMVHGPQQFDLILLDVVMGGIDGYEVCRRLKADPNPLIADVPIIFSTSLDGIEEQRRSFALGAVDFVPKPINAETLLARVNTHVKLYCASRLLLQQNNEMSLRQQVISNVVHVLRQSDQYYRKNLRTIVAPMEVSNGDVLLSARGPDRRQFLLQGDFMGHGLQAAVCVPLVSYIFYSMVQRGHAMAEILFELNSALCRRLPVNYFLCAHLIELSPDRSGMRYWNFASPDLLIYRQGALLQRIASHALPLGVTEPLQGECSGVEVMLQPADRVCFFTDGIVETASPRGERFGIERVIAFLVDADDSFEELILELRQFAGDNGLRDDVTVAELTI